MSPPVVAGVEDELTSFEDGSASRPAEIAILVRAQPAF
jgi:hypothetical protein